MISGHRIAFGWTHEIGSVVASVELRVNLSPGEEKATNATQSESVLAGAITPLLTKYL